MIFLEFAKSSAKLESIVKRCEWLKRSINFQIGLGCVLSQCLSETVFSTHRFPSAQANPLTNIMDLMSKFTNIELLLPSWSKHQFVDYFLVSLFDSLLLNTFLSILISDVSL